jgi:hypothetical protein
VAAALAEMVTAEVVTAEVVPAGMRKIAGKRRR